MKKEFTHLGLKPAGLGYFTEVDIEYKLTETFSKAYDPNVAGSKSHLQMGEYLHKSPHVVLCKQVESYFNISDATYSKMVKAAPALFSPKIQVIYCDEGYILKASQHFPFQFAQELDEPDIQGVLNKTPQQHLNSGAFNSVLNIEGSYVFAKIKTDLPSVSYTAQGRVHIDRKPYYVYDFQEVVNDLEPSSHWLYSRYVEKKGGIKGDHAICSSEPFNQSPYAYLGPIFQRELTFPQPIGKLLIDAIREGWNQPLVCFRLKPQNPMGYRKKLLIYLFVVLFTIGFVVFEAIAAANRWRVPLGVNRIASVWFVGLFSFTGLVAGCFAVYQCRQRWRLAEEYTSTEFDPTPPPDCGPLDLYSNPESSL